MSSCVGGRDHCYHGDYCCECGTRKMAPSLPTTGLARFSDQTLVARAEDYAFPEMADLPTVAVQVLRPVEPKDIEIILNHLRIRHRETLSRQEYCELDAIIKRLES